MNPDSINRPSSNQFPIAELQKVPFEFVKTLDRHLIDTRMSVVEAQKEIMVHVEGFLWGERRNPDPVNYPRDWWQAFKGRWFPQWALRKWPVIETCHHLEFLILYPDFRPVIPDEKHIVKFTAHQEDRARMFSQ